MGEDLPPGRVSMGLIELLILLIIIIVLLRVAGVF